MATGLQRGDRPAHVAPLWITLFHGQLPGLPEEVWNLGIPRVVIQVEETFTGEVDVRHLRDRGGEVNGIVLRPGKAEVEACKSSVSEKQKSSGGAPRPLPTE